MHIKSYTIVTINIYIIIVTNKLPKLGKQENLLHLNGFTLLLYILNNVYVLKYSIFIEKGRSTQNSRSSKVSKGPVSVRAKESRADSKNSDTADDGNHI